MEQNEEVEQIIRPGRKRSYSDHNMVKLAYRFNKKKLEKENKNIFGKDISEFITIINELAVSLPNFLNYSNKYFLSLQTKMSILIQQINNAKNINFIIGENEISNLKKGENGDIKEEKKNLIHYFTILIQLMILINLL